jgi:hypothetical protein
MAMGFKFSLLVLVIFAFSATAFGDGPSCGGTSLAPLHNTIVGQCGKAIKLKELQCAAPTTADAAFQKACQKCLATVHELKTDLIPTASLKYAKSDDLTQGSSSSVIYDTGLNADSSAKDTIQAAGTVKETAQAAKLKVKKNADNAQASFQQCLQKLNASCSGLTPSANDKQIVDSLYEICQNSEEAARQSSTEAAVSSSSLGNLAGLADLTTKALGAAGQLAKMLGGTPGASTPPPDSTLNPSNISADGGTSPTPNSPGSETSSTGGSSPGSPTAIVGFGVPPAANGVGTSSPSGSYGSGSGASSSPYRDLASASSPLGSGGVGATTGAIGGGGGASAGGSSNGTGASRPGEGKGAAPAGDTSAANNYEMNSGGGRAFVGLKPGKGDLDAVTDGALALPSLGSAKLDDFGAKPSGDSAAADDPLAKDSESIFLRVRQKYSLLKGSGKI